jgi:predicted signal transduction protein with EAL and GGDEF domain
VKLGDEETPVTVTASIGIATGDRSSAGDLLRDADIAMYRAKWGNRYVVFECGMADAVQSRMELEMDLRVALENREFFLAFQPTFNLSDMSPTGLEALIRWHSPTRGVVQPDDFIPVLEETGLIVDIGRWVLQQPARRPQNGGRRDTRSVSRSTSPLGSSIAIESSRTCTTRWQTAALTQRRSHLR